MLSQTILIFLLKASGKKWEGTVCTSELEELQVLQILQIGAKQTARLPSYEVK